MPAPAGRTSPLRRAAPVVVALAALSLAVSACRIDVGVDVAVQPDGSGAVDVEVTFDPEAAALLGDPGTALALDDLEGSGWTVVGPDTRPDGSVVVGATRPFVDPADGQAVLDEVAGADVLTLDVDVDGQLVRTETRLDGTVDLAAGLDAFADPGIDAATGLPFGGVVADVEAREGRPVADLVGVEVRWSLDDTTSAVVTPRLGDPPVTSTLEVAAVNVGRVVALGVLGAVVVGALVFLVVRRVVRARRRPLAAADPVGDGQGPPPADGDEDPVTVPEQP
jgi:hypothetical protein